MTWGRLGLAETGNYPEPATPSLYNAMGSTQLARVLMEASGRLEPKAGDTTGSVWRSAATDVTAEPRTSLHRAVQRHVHSGTVREQQTQ